MQLKLFSHWDAHDERPTGVLCVKDLHLLRSCDFWASLDQRSKGIQRFRFSTLTGDFECPKNLETLEPFAFSSVASGHQLFDVLLCCCRIWIWCLLVISKRCPCKSSMRMSPENNVMHHIKQSVFTLAKSSPAFLHFFFLTRLQSAG